MLRRSLQKKKKALPKIYAFPILQNAVVIRISHHKISSFSKRQWRSSSPLLLQSKVCSMIDSRCSRPAYCKPLQPSNIMPRLHKLDDPGLPKPLSWMTARSPVSELALYCVCPATPVTALDSGAPPPTCSRAPGEKMDATPNRVASDSQLLDVGNIVVFSVVGTVSSAIGNT